jgi:hypothetical protein
MTYLESMLHDVAHAEDGKHDDWVTIKITRSDALHLMQALRFKQLSFADVKALLDRTEEEGDFFLKKWMTVKP